MNHGQKRSRMQVTQVERGSSQQHTLSCSPKIFSRSSHWPSTPSSPSEALPLIPPRTGSRLDGTALELDGTPISKSLPTGPTLGQDRAGARFPIAVERWWRRRRRRWQQLFCWRSIFSCSARTIHSSGGLKCHRRTLYPPTTPAEDSGRCLPPMTTPTEIGEEATHKFHTNEGSRATVTVKRMVSQKRDVVHK